MKAREMPVTGPGLTLDDLNVEFGDMYASDDRGTTPGTRFRSGLKTARSVCALRAKVVADRSGL